MPDKPSSDSARALPLRAPLTILLALLAAVFLLLGLRGVLLPDTGAQSLGIVVVDAADLALMQTTGARNIGLALLAAGLIVLDARRSLAVLLFAATIISALDFLIVLNASGLASAAKHLGYVALLAVLCGATFRTGAPRPKGS